MTVSILACACSSSLSDAFAGVHAGMSRAQVREQLGEPHGVQLGKLPEGPFFGPSEALLRVLKRGAPFERWQYADAETIYLVWFGGTTQQAQDKWKVIATHSYPKGAVF